MTTGIAAPRFIRAIDPYTAGKPISELARERGLDPSDILKLASNENPLGAPESAVKAMMAAATNSELALYPDGNAYALRKAIAERFGVPMDWVMVGNGSDEIVSLVCSTMLEPGLKTIYSQYYFSVYRIDTLACGAVSVEVPARGFDIDLDAIADAVDDKTRLIILTTPNNPTGRILTGPQLEEFLGKIPESVTVLLDEAYADFVPKEERYDSVGLVRRHPNLIITRTFSKAYGLAGLRIGFAICSGELIGLMNRIRPPFNCNAMGQAAAAACIGDDEFLERVYEMNRAGMRQLEKALRELGLEFVESRSNFVLVRIGPGAANLNEKLLSRGIIIRPCASFGLPEWIRVSVGTAEQNERFIRELSELVPALQGKGV